MSQNVNAEIIAIGTEILLGEITDTNSVYISRVLRDIGVNLYFMTAVGDNEGRIAEAIRIAFSRADVVITCGGLGPTIDDMTRQSVALATDRGLTFHQALLDKIAERFLGFRSQMTENNRRQAYLPDDAIVIENPVGTAPSFIVEHNDRVVISLPGVPREMKYLLNEQVVPYLRRRFALGSIVIKARVLKTAGIGESALDELIGKALLEASNPTVGLAAHSGQVDVRITAKAENVEAADKLIAVVENELRQRIDEYIFGVDEDVIQEKLANTLHEQSRKIAIVEAGIEPVTSRFLLNENADVIGKHEVFDAPEVLKSEKGIQSHNLRKLAELAAERIATEAGSDVGIAIVSYPDMDEHHDDDVEGSATAVYFNGNIRSRVYGFGGDSEIAKQWTSTWVMATAWRMLTE